MKKTVREFVGCHREQVPVMRNGKPTKRTKEVWVDEYKEFELVEVKVEGHTAYISTNDTDLHTVYNEEGNPITAIYGLGNGSNTTKFNLCIENGKIKETFPALWGYSGRKYTLRKILW